MSNSLQIKENTTKLLNFVGKKVQDGDLNNESLVQLIELAGVYLGLKTISDHAKANNMSYNGVKNNREIINLFNVKFVIDNE